MLFSYELFFAETNLFFSNNQTVNIIFDEVTPDIWINVRDGKKSDSYKIEAIGPASNIDSVITDVINGKNILITEINLGDPGGRAKTEIKKLYIFEISSDCKINLLEEKTIIDIYYYPSDQSVIKFQQYFYTYDSSVKEITLYDSKAYNISEVEKIRLKDYVK